MPTSFTTNLRLSNPGLGDTGWGSTVSNGMIDLVDPAIAGTTTLSADTDVILTTANGMTDQARQMILNCTGSRAAQRTITAPASSKVYVVINGTTGGFGVKIVGVGPTTGVVVPAGRMAVVAWNGSDFVTLGAVVDLTASGNVTVAGTLGVGTTSPTAKLHVAGQTRIQDSASASNYILIGSGTNAPRGGNSVMAQTGSMVMGTEAASSLFFVTNAATAMTLDASGNLGVGTTSPTGAKVVIEGSASAPSVFNALALRNSLDGSVALIFDNSTSATLASIEALITSTGAGTDDGVLAFGTALNGVNAERMRLDSSGNLGLGVTPSAWVAGANALQLGSGGYTALSAATGGDSNLTSNVYLSAAGTWTAIVSLGASRYQLDFGAHRWFTAPSGTAGNAITFTQAMTLNNAGDLGIGTNSPSARLHVDAASSGSGLIVGYVNQTASEVNIGIGYRTAGHPFVGTNTNSNPLDIGTRSNTHTAFVTNDTERARFTAVGDFLVGLTSAQTWGVDGGGAFQVGGGRPCILSTSGGNISFKGDSGGWSMGLYANGSNNTYRGGFGFVGSADSLTYYWVGTAFNGTGVQLTSGGTSWSTLSDSRDKNIYGEIENALEKIGGIRSVYYSFKTDDQSAPRRVGFIAQEVQAVLPEAVSEVQRELENPTEESKRLMLSYTEVIPLLTKAIQEQQALITELRTRVAALEVK